MLRAIKTIGFMNPSPRDVLLEQPEMEREQDYSGREEWEVIDRYRKALEMYGVDLNDDKLHQVIEAYPYNCEIGIQAFLETTTSKDEGNTYRLVFAIQQGISHYDHPN